MALAPLIALLLLAAPPPGAWLFDAPLGGAQASLVRVASSGLRRPLLSVPVRPGDLPRGSLSPDGRHAAWTVVPPGGRGLQDSLVQVGDLATGSVRTLEERAESLDTPRWSPNGERLAYLRVVAVHPPPPTEGKIQRQATEDWELWTIGADGSAPARAYASTTYGLSLVALTADGPLLYEDDGLGDYRVLAITPLGGARTLASLAGPARAFQLVDAGRSLVYAVRTEGTRQWAVLRSSVTTGKTAALLEAEGDRLEPFVAGSSLLVSAPGQLERLSLATGQPIAPPLPEALIEAATQDGRWAVARDAQGLELLDVTRGTAEPLPARPIAATLGFAIVQQR